MNTFELFKSSGVGIIFPALPQQTHKELLIHMIWISLSSLKLGYIPEPWKRVRATFILKVGKTDTHILNPSDN